MKNGRALKGHKRVLSAVGVIPLTKRPPSGGWNVGCTCGWYGGHHMRSEPARAAYRAHIDDLIDHGLFRCKRCGVEKPSAEMRPDYRYLCLICFSELGNTWQEAHPTASARHKRKHHLLKTFGVTLEEMEQLLAKQGWVCAICGEPISDKRGYAPHVDHDHESGRVRGILCFHCNTGLGQFKDDPARLLAAIHYLNRTKGDRA